MANAKKIVGIILLVIGLIMIIFFGFSMVIVGSQSSGWGMVFIAPLIVAVIVFLIGTVLLLTSRKKNSKSPDKSIT